MPDWTTVAIQAGGAIAVCAMFLWYLAKKQVADDAARAQFLEHLEAKDKAMNDAIDKQVEYLQKRDAQSKEIALSGYASLNGLTAEIAAMKQAITSRFGESVE